MIECTGRASMSFRHQRIRLDRGLERFLAQTVRRDRADDPVPVAQRHEIVGNGPCHDEAVFDRLVTVAIAQRDLVTRNRCHEDHAVRHRGAVRYAVGTMGAEHAGRIPFMLAHGARVIEERAQTPDADRKIRAQQVLAEKIEEDPADRRLEKRGAARVSRRVPGIFVLLREAHQGRGQWRQHELDVTADGSGDAPADEGRRVLQRPDELIDHLHHFHRDGRGFTPFRHQEDGDLVITRTDEFQKGAGSRMTLVITQRPVDQHRVDSRVRRNDGRAVLGRGRFDDLDVATLHLLYERSRGAPLCGRSTELIVHDECTHAQALDAALNHFDYSSGLLVTFPA